jgi:formylglycine-generating enzyme required for sulfatase activity
VSETQPDARLVALLTELHGLTALPDRARRAQRAWELILQAADHPDFPMVIGFALQHGLAQACDAATRTWLNPGDDAEMVWVPEGHFYLGADKRPAYSAGFALARHPVTNAQFRRFLDATGYTPADATDFLAHWRGSKVPAGLENHPVVWVSCRDALSYCWWAGLSLPTEWLWEKAARGGDARPFPWGSNLPISRRDDWRGGKRLRKIESANLANVATDRTVPVGSYPRTRSAFGCEDMVGNVSEWCQPDVGPEPGALPRPLASADIMSADGQAPVRGSCYLRIDTSKMQSWHRRRLSLERRNRWVGFRPALFLPCRPLDEA